MMKFERNGRTIFQSCTFFSFPFSNYLFQNLLETVTTYTYISLSVFPHESVHLPSFSSLSLLPSLYSKPLDSSAQNDWPPKDEFSEQRKRLGLDDSQSSQSRRRRREVNLTKSPFTYGTGLNPDLIPSSSSTTAGEVRNRKRPKRSKLIPYQQDQQDQVFSSSEEEEEEEDSIPLSTLASRRNPSLSTSLNINLNQLEPRTNIRIRRGSEGFEVKPIIINHLRNHEQEGEWDSEEEEEEEGSEEFDQDGDRLRSQNLGRYKVYEPEQDSESDSSEFESEAEEREEGEDSMDEYLEDQLVI